MNKLEDEDIQRQRQRRRHNTDVVADGEIWSVPMHFMDSTQRAVALAATPVMHAPGSARYSDEQNARRALAYSAYERRLTDAWRVSAPSPAASAADNGTSSAVPSTPAAGAAPPAGPLPVGSAGTTTDADHYRRYEARVSAAWKTQLP